MTLREILDPRNMFDLCKSPEGKAQVKEAALVARITMGVHEQLRYLNEELGVFLRPLTYEEQQNVCNIILHYVLRAKHEEVLAFIMGIPEETIEDHVEIIGNC